MLEFRVGHWGGQLTVCVDPYHEEVYRCVRMSYRLECASNGMHRLLLRLDPDGTKASEDKTLKWPVHYEMKLSPEDDLRLPRFCLHDMEFEEPRDGEAATLLEWDHELPWPQLKTNHLSMMPDPSGLAQEELSRRCASARAQGADVKAVIAGAPSWVVQHLDYKQWMKAVGLLALFILL